MAPPWKDLGGLLATKVSRLLILCQVQCGLVLPVFELCSPLAGGGGELARGSCCYVQYRKQRSGSHPWNNSFCPKEEMEQQISGLLLFALIFWILDIFGYFR